MYLVSIFEANWLSKVLTQEELDIWRLYKNKNCAFPLMNVTVFKI